MLLKEDYKKKFRRCILEYTSLDNGLYEVGDEDPNAAPAGVPGGNMGGDPGMGSPDAGMGGDPNMGGDPGMGGDPNIGGDPNMGGDPGMGGAAPGGDGQGPEGFQPQNVDPNAGLDGMGSDPNAENGGENPGPEPGPDAAPQGPDDEMPEEGGEEEEVIDVDELTDTQEETEKKVEALSKKFEKVMNSLDSIEKRISDIDAHTNQYLGSLKTEFEKRNPTPMQRMTMRSAKSAPYGMTPNEYMNNYAPDNYSSESDNNGADDPQYKITKDDIDNFTDYSSIAKEFDGKMGLHDILGY